MHYTSREKCVITGSKDLEPLYTLDNFPVFIGCTDQEQSKDIFADMEWGISKSSGVIQLTKLLSPDIVYSGYHSEAVGSIWKQHHEEFANFIIKHANTTSIVEMGGSNGILAELCCKIDKNINWTVVEPIPDPNYSPSTSKISIKKSFIEDELDLLSNNKLFIHSHVLEHLYDPLTTMNAVVQQQSDGDMMIFSVPDLYKYLDEKYVNTINFEHTYLLTEHVMDYLLGELGFLIKEKKKFKGHSIFYCAELIGKEEFDQLWDSLTPLKPTYN